ncbi:MAG: hypothetical protein EKK55_07085 [Rhodocyclaceae bacterium]|nr:MAG: hypothetical protein EKK55_07085 [Rhodocyclaceae bacterium]
MTPGNPALKDLGARLDALGLGGLLGAATARPPAQGAPAVGSPPERAVPEGVRPAWEGADAKGHPHRLASDGRTFVAYEVAETRASCGEPVWKTAPLPFLPEAEARVAVALGNVEKLDVAALALRTIAQGQMNASDAAQFAGRTVAAVDLAEGPTVPPSRPPPPPAPTTLEPVAFTAEVIDFVRSEQRLIVVVRSEQAPQPGDQLTFENGTKGYARRVTPKDGGGFDVHLPAEQLFSLGPVACRRERHTVTATLGETQMRFTLEGNVLRLARSDMQGEATLTTTEDDGLLFAGLGPAGLKVLAQVAFLSAKGERMAQLVAAAARKESGT